MTTFLVLLTAFGAWAGDTLKDVEKKGVLIVGVADDLPPFSFKAESSGNLIGYDIDFVTALADELGVKLELKPVTVANRLSDLVDGDIDLITNLSHANTRNGIVAFSENYLTSGQKILAKADKIKNLDDLKGKKIGAVVGTFSESCARDRCKVSKIVPFDSYLDGIKALQNGDIDAFTSDETILTDLLAGLPGGGYEIPDVFILRDEYHLGLRRGDKNFLNFVNAKIGNMKKSGEAIRIRKKWFTPSGELPPPAYGAIVRKASSRPRFLGIAISGFLEPQTAVSIVALDGRTLGKGTISSVFGDEFYLDVDESIYELVQPGYLVAMSMNEVMAMDVLMKRHNLLKEVKTEAEREEEAIQAVTDKEGLEKEMRANEMDSLRERNRISIRRDRSNYFGYYGRRRYRFR